MQCTHTNILIVSRYLHSIFYHLRVYNFHKETSTVGKHRVFKIEKLFERTQNNFKNIRYSLEYSRKFSKK